MTDTTLTIPAAFVLGLLSTIHCIGMCGSIMGALSLSLPESIRNNRLLRFGFVSAYNLGRIISYTLAGFIAGSIGIGLFESTGLSSASGHTILQALGVAVMVTIGLYLAGWLPQISYFEKIGIPIWRQLEPIGRKMMPVNSIPKALLYGMVWGWLPCGLVYTALLFTLTSGGAASGALTMLAFGLGTLPTLIATGVMTSWLTRFAHSVTARRTVGIIIILMAIGSLFISIGGEHAHPNH